ADEGVEGGRRRGDQRFAFTGRDLGEGPVVQDDAGGKLDVEWPKSDVAIRCLADQAEDLGQQKVEALAAAGTPLEAVADLEDLLVGELTVFLLPVADGSDLQGAVREPALRRVNARQHPKVAVPLGAEAVDVAASDD